MLYGRSWWDIEPGANNCELDALPKVIGLATKDACEVIFVALQVPPHGTSVKSRSVVWSEGLAPRNVFVYSYWLRWG